MFVRGVAQGECSKHTRMKHEKREDGTKTCLSCGMSVTECETSSGHFVRMYRFSHRIDERVRMVARSRRERMVAHDIAEAPFLLPLVMWRGTLFE